MSVGHLLSQLLRLLVGLPRSVLVRLGMVQKCTTKRPSYIEEHLDVEVAVFVEAFVGSTEGGLAGEGVGDAVFLP